MVTAVTQTPIEPWRRRLYVPNYRVVEAARYAEISSQTVAAWHRLAGSTPVLSERENGDALSYMQLVEIAVVAAFRKAGITLKRIREAREYISHELKSEFPFAEYRFKSNGKTLLVDYEQIVGSTGRDKFLEANKSGQLAWKEMLDRRLHQFEYDDGGVVVKWHLRGDDSSVFIDPRVAFGVPIVNGTPTWVVKSRWEAGESITDIADDFGLSSNFVQDALTFEGIKPDFTRENQWVN